MNRKIPVTIWGATGFAGGELLRIIARHPAMDVAGAISRSKAGTPIGAVHPHLRHAYPEMKFISPEDGNSVNAELAFLALPHRASAEEAKRRLDSGQMVVDLSADFRLRSADDYKKWYGIDHPCPDLLNEAVYGLPELHRAEMRNARLISGVGCNATSAICALLPIIRGDLMEETRIETPESFGMEYLSQKCSIKTVENIDEALEHIRQYSSKHSEAIVSNNPAFCERFLNEVDAAAVYTNASTRFTDGGCFGLGAEIGISTQKLHARGPFALEKLTTEKWIVRGNGQTR